MLHRGSVHSKPTRLKVLMRIRRWQTSIHRPTWAISSRKRDNEHVAEEAQRLQKAPKGNRKAPTWNLSRTQTRIRTRQIPDSDSDSADDGVSTGISSSRGRGRGRGPSGGSAAAAGIAGRQGHDDDDSEEETDQPGARLRVTVMVV